MSCLRHASVTVFVLLLVCIAATAGDTSFTEMFTKVDVVASTVPPNGDVNPYGVALVRHSVGSLTRGHVLVSNFNNAATTQNPGGLQGTGTTIVDVDPKTGNVSVFASISGNNAPDNDDCPGGVGLTTALVVLRSGWVIVGSLPTSDGTAATAQAGCLIVLNSTGRVVKTFSGGAINGPWDMTAIEGDDLAELFVTNVLNGLTAEDRANNTVVNQGTVLRILLFVPDRGAAPIELERTIIGSGFSEKSDPAALVVGPTGVGLGCNGVLYVADAVNSRVAAIRNAIFRSSSADIGRTVFSGQPLNAPLGLAIAPNCNILTVNGGDGNLVEVDPDGEQINVVLVNPGGAGTLFGLAVAAHGKGIYLVDDGNNQLDLLH